MMSSRTYSGRLLVQRLADRGDILGRADDDAELHAGLAFHVLDREDVRRLAGRDDQLVPVDRDRDDVAPLDEVRLQLLEGRLVHVLGREVAELQAVELGLRFEHVVGADESLFEQRRSRIDSGLGERLPAQPAVLLVGDLVHLEQDIHHVAHVRAARRLGGIQIAQSPHLGIVRIDRGRSPPDSAPSGSAPAGP